MASSQELGLLLLTGRTLAVYHGFISGVGALWFYDYFLTLSDEVEFIWSGGVSFTFVLFVLNRYWPLWYVIWVFVAFFCPQFAKPVCDKTTWFSMFYFAFATTFAQMAITLRIYAVTRNNHWVASYMSFVTVTQFIFGMFFSIRLLSHPAVPVPELPFNQSEFCTFQRWRTGELVFIVLSLLYDVSAFVLIVVSAKLRGRTLVAEAPSLLDKVLQDATTYFLVLFTGHLIFVFFELFASEPIQLLPGSGMAVVIPLMVTRLILSLKKAAKTPSTMWSAEQVSTIMFARRTIGGIEHGGGSDNIPLKQC